MPHRALVGQYKGGWVDTYCGDIAAPAECELRVRPSKQEKPVHLSIDVNLHTLHCITPTDPSGEDEPYLWTFFIRADGETIRQNTTIPDMLSANVQIDSGPGRPGNLLVGGVESGANIRIPASMGQHSNELRPIVLQFSTGGSTFRFFVPGVLFVVAVLIDEEGVPRDAMEGAHEDVRKLLKRRIDDFFNAFNLQPLIDQAISQGSIDAAMKMFRDSVNAFIGNRNSGLIKEATDAAKQSAKIAVMSSWNPFVHLAAGFDEDELIGTARMEVREDQIIKNKLIQEAPKDIRQSASGLGGAWYELHGGASAELSFNQADAQIRTQTKAPVVAGTGEHVFTEGKLCIAKGARVQWSRLDHRQTYEVAIEYPFVEFQYRLDGQKLEGKSGVVQIAEKDVWIPQFDPNTYEFVRYSKEKRSVKVTFSRGKRKFEPQIKQLTLANDPADGSYWLTLDIDAVLDDGSTIFAGQHVIEFDGQTIELPRDFIEWIEKCLEPLTGTRFSESIRVGPKELWGPYGRQQRYEQIEQAVDAIATVRGEDAAITEAVKNAMAARLKVQR